MKSSINLLPNEYAVTEKQQKKIGLIQTISVVFMLILFLSASVIVALRIFQSKNLSTAQQKTKEEEAAVLQFKDKEASLFVLKNRLNTITQLLKSPSKQLAMYSFLEGIVPANVNLTSISADKSGSVTISALAPDEEALDSMMTVLTNEAAFEVFTQIEIENLARGKDGTFRLNLKVIPK